MVDDSFYYDGSGTVVNRLKGIRAERYVHKDKGGV